MQREDDYYKQLESRIRQLEHDVSIANTERRIQESKIKDAIQEKEKSQDILQRYERKLIEYRLTVDFLKKEIKQTRNICKLAEAKSTKVESELGFERNIRNTQQSNHQLHNQILYNQNKILQDRLSQVFSQEHSMRKSVKMQQIKVIALAGIIGFAIIAFLPTIQENLTQYMSYEKFQLSEPVNDLVVVDSLRGDTIDAPYFWRVSNSKIMDVTILNYEGLSEKKINIIKDTILSTDSIKVDDSVLHKGTEGQKSTYFIGWKGVIQDIQSKSNTPITIPSKFNIMVSDQVLGDIIIKPVSYPNKDGYDGYTINRLDGNRILQSTIILYDIENKDDDQFAKLVRHEFGHALGLGHSTAPEDLMAPSMGDSYPYISPCMKDALEQLYTFGLTEEVTCKL
ncbi:MAG: matrixin family metalloprotease [Nitrosopumilus sp.]